MRQQILVDMDGVLADVYAQLIIFEYRDSGIKLNIETRMENRTGSFSFFRETCEK